MKLQIALASSLLALVAASPASAASVIGDLGSTGFSYGTLTGTGFAAYTPYASGASECLNLGECYRGNDTYAIIAASTNANELLVHPGPGAGGNSAVSYAITSTGSYTLSSLFTSADVGAKNVGYFTIINGVLSTFDFGSIAGTDTKAVGGTFVLNGGDSLGVFVNNGNGVYQNDSTHVSGTISAVPETATWMMMLAGFGLVGAGLRSRKQAVRVTYA